VHRHGSDGAVAQLLSPGARRAENRVVGVAQQGDQIPDLCVGGLEQLGCALAHVRSVRTRTEDAGEVQDHYGGHDQHDTDHEE
jgi:hypothetical protein